MKNLSRAVLVLLFACSGTSAAGKIDINTASLDDLVKITHLGEKRARELISLRPFSSLDELAKIKGIGPARIEDIKKQGLAYAGPFPERATEFSKTTKSTTETEVETKTTPQQSIKGLAEAAEQTVPLTTETTPPSTSKIGESLKIDINTASAQELQVLVRIGAVLAQSIIEARPFYSLDELIKVRGIGAGTLENIKDQGMAWVDPNLTLAKTEEAGLFDKSPAAASAPWRQTRDKEAPNHFPVSLVALALAFSSGITILTLKRKLKSFS